MGDRDDQRLVKPDTVVDRDREWQLLTDFVTDPSPAMRLGIVSGRRRHGKSYLLTALAEATGGLYVTAIREEGRVAALRRFGESLAAYTGLRAESLQLDDWHDVLTDAIHVTARRAPVPVLVIDELPYLLQHSPEIPGVIQKLYDDDQRGPGTGVRLILCGSAISVMHELLSGAKALRGRAVVDLRLGGFDHRTSRAFWGVEDPFTALQVDSVLGGAPGYRTIAGRPTPNAGFESWLAETVLNPGRAVYSRTETDYLLREEPRITQSTLYYDVLTAVAQGAHSQAKVGAALGRQRSAVAHPLAVLEDAGYVRREPDILRARHPVISVADPIVRFNQLVTLPMVSTLEQSATGPEGLRDVAAQVWRASAPTYNAKVLGPHFEELSRRWVRTAGHVVLPGGLPGPVGTTEVADPRRRRNHQVDVVGLALGERTQAPRAKVVVLGEAKATVAPRGTADLERLEHIRSLLADQHHDVDGAVLALFSLYGFQPDLQRAAARRPDVLLVGLPTLYGDEDA